VDRRALGDRLQEGDDLQRLSNFLFTYSARSRTAGQDAARLERCQERARVAGRDDRVAGPSLSLAAIAVENRRASGAAARRRARAREPDGGAAAHRADRGCARGGGLAVWAARTTRR